MSKYFKLIFSIAIIISAVFLFYIIASSSTMQTANNALTKSYSNTQYSNKIEDKSPNTTIRKDSSDLASKNLDNVEGNDQVSNDYSILITSSLYNAIFYLDMGNKEVNIKLLETKDIGQTPCDKYIKLSNDDIDFLKANASNLINEFITCNIFDKYDMMSNFLNKFDTNLKENDIINLAFSYLK